ncbi:conserved hypothetical protein [Sphingomonas sp. OV641]|nr:conserved hypothetical protein [Sphingomonas sp. OV641]
MAPEPSRCYAKTVRRSRFLDIAATFLSLIAAYPITGWIVGAIPSNKAWSEPEQGVTLFVESNGIHVGLVMPKRAAGVDWRPIFPGSDLRDGRYAGHDHIAVGWGERDFYLETPTWADLRFRTVLAAAWGSNDTLVHVDHVPAPASDRTVRRLIVRPAEYRRLAAYVQASLVRGGRRYLGYFGNDAFYQAQGRYTAFHTCNAWIGDALRYAGIRTGVWTPFPATVQWWYARHA